MRDRSIAIPYQVYWSAVRLSGFLYRQDAWAQVRDLLENSSLERKRWDKAPHPMYRTPWGPGTGCQWWGKVEVSQARLEPGTVDGKDSLRLVLTSGRCIRIAQSNPDELAGFFPADLAVRDATSDGHTLQACSFEPDDGFVAYPPSDQDRARLTFVVPSPMFHLLADWCQRTGPTDGFYAMVPVPYAAFLLGKQWTEDKTPCVSALYPMNGNPGSMCYGNYGEGTNAGSSLHDLHEHRPYFHHDADLVGGDTYLWDPTPLIGQIPRLRQALTEWEARQQKPGAPSTTTNRPYWAGKLDLALTNALVESPGWYLDGSGGWFGIDGSRMIRRRDLPAQGSVRRVRVNPYVLRRTLPILHGVRLDPESNSITYCQKTLQDFLAAVEIYSVVRNSFPSDRRVDYPRDLGTDFERWWFRYGGWNTHRNDYLVRFGMEVNRTQSRPYQIETWVHPEGGIDLFFPEHLVQRAREGTLKDVPGVSSERCKTDEEYLFACLSHYLWGSDRWNALDVGSAIWVLAGRDAIYRRTGKEIVERADIVGKPTEAEIRTAVHKYLKPIELRKLLVWRDNPPGRRDRPYDLADVDRVAYPATRGPGIRRSMEPIPENLEWPDEWGPEEQSNQGPWVTVRRLSTASTALPTWTELGDTNEDIAPPAPPPPPRRHESEDEEDEEGLRTCPVCDRPYDEDREGTTCSYCGNSVCHECYYTCSACDDDVCRTCYEGLGHGGFCDGCDEFFCGDCLSSCDECNEFFCGDCLETCSYCGRSICSQCMEDGLCDRCHQTTGVCERCDRRVSRDDLFPCRECGRQVCEECGPECTECCEVFCEEHLTNGLCRECLAKQEAEDTEEGEGQPEGCETILDE